MGSEAASARPVSQSSRVLLVQPTSVNAFYDTQRLVYSRTDGQRAYYQFAAWTERPGRALSELLARRLDAPSTTSGVKGDLILHTRLEELYHDASASPGSVKIAVSAGAGRRRRPHARRAPALLAQRADGERERGGRRRGREPRGGAKCWTRSRPGSKEDNCAASPSAEPLSVRSP